METPTRIDRNAEQHAFLVSWRDDHQGFLPYRFLRLSCQCAMCVHEITGELLIREETIPQDVEPAELSLVGNYALKIRWSDGHDTGLFTWDRLLELCQCEKCRSRR